MLIATLQAAGWEVQGAYDDAETLAQALLAYLRDPELRRRHGEAARERVRRHFRREAVWGQWEAAIRSVVAGDLGIRNEEEGQPGA